MDNALGFDPGDRGSIPFGGTSYGLLYSFLNVTINTKRKRNMEKINLEMLRAISESNNLSEVDMQSGFEQIHKACEKLNSNLSLIEKNIISIIKKQNENN